MMIGGIRGSYAGRGLSPGLMFPYSWRHHTTGRSFPQPRFVPCKQTDMRAALVATAGAHALPALPTIPADVDPQA